MYRPGVPRCDWCGKELEVKPRGRPRRWCDNRDRCRSLYRAQIARHGEGADLFLGTSRPAKPLDQLVTALVEAHIIRARILQTAPKLPRAVAARAIALAHDLARALETHFPPPPGDTT